MRLKATQADLIAMQLEQSPDERVVQLEARVEQLKAELKAQAELGEARLAAAREEYSNASSEHAAKAEALRIAEVEAANQKLRAVEASHSSRIEATEAQVAEMEQVIEDLHSALMDAMSAKGDLLCLER